MQLLRKPASLWLPVLETLCFLCPSEASLCDSYFFFPGRPVYADTSKVKSLSLSWHCLICFSNTTCCICEVDLPFNFRDNHNRRLEEIKQTFKIARAVRCPQNWQLDPKLDGWPVSSQAVHQQPNHRSDQLQCCSYCPLAFTKKPCITGQRIFSTGITFKDGGKSQFPKENAHICHLMKDLLKEKRGKSNFCCWLYKHEEMGIGLPPHFITAGFFLDLRTKKMFVTACCSATFKS